jgi:hypothetical protein
VERGRGHEARGVNAITLCMGISAGGGCWHLRPIMGLCGARVHGCWFELETLGVSCCNGNSTKRPPAGLTVVPAASTGTQCSAAAVLDGLR